ncbi:scavenger receptor class B member 1 [Aplysia californica]|uniref:Scavenger receptor class B member 1 n=1 Tax=Aplysia californica TaxID=6500 RepID=A0ABM0JX23_APLCA|nr:scavenger receptor class B member 1 [Aplysia californica]
MSILSFFRPTSGRLENLTEDELKKAMAKQSESRLLIPCLLLGLGLLLVVAGVTFFFVLDPFIRSQVEKKMIVSPKSETYDVWQNVPIPVYMQFYVFNVTNVEEVLAGEKPYLTQWGPYTYRERREKFNIVWNPNGTVTYKQNRTFHFIPEMSKGSETDMITTVNPLLPVIAENIKWLPSAVKDIMTTFLQVGLKENLFFTRPVKDILWGYDDPALKMLQKILPSWFTRTNIGYFIRKNYTDDGVYTIMTGATNINLLGIITEYNGRSHLDIWTSRWANMVNGSDGTLGPPFRFSDQYTPVFVSDICRSIRGLYYEDVQVKGITVRRYGGDRYDMANATVNPDNIGFCTPRSKCLPTGLLNSTLCQEPVDKFHLPIIFSFPHFLYADPAVQDSVWGLAPTVKEHQTVIDKEPWTGLALRVANRLQINIFVEQVQGIPQTAKVRKLFFPILWINESSVTDDKHANMLKTELFLPMKIAKIGRVVVLAIGALIIVASVALLIRRQRKIAKLKYAIDLARVNSTGSEGAPVTTRGSNRLFHDPVNTPFTPTVRVSPRSTQSRATSYGSFQSSGGDSLHSLPDSDTASTTNLLNNHDQ